MSQQIEQGSGHTEVRDRVGRWGAEGVLGWRLAGVVKEMDLFNVLYKVSRISRVFPSS